MPINLRSKSGGGVFVPTVLSTGSSIPVSSSGEILRLEPPAGKRVKLNMAMASGLGNNGISVLINGSKIIDDQVLKGDNSSAGLNSFCIGIQGVTDNQEPSEINGAHPAIIFGADEVVTVEASTPTGNVTYYNYEYGELR